MSLPASVREAVESALAESGAPARIARALSVGGGCVNRGARIETERADRFFLKHNPSAPLAMFEAERDGLLALGDAASAIDEPARPRVPEPLALGTSEAGTWLLMEWIEPGRPTSGDAARLGRALARLHSLAPPFGPHGWPADNWIGSLPQANRPCDDWASFWRERRIVPQLEAARRAGHLAEPLMDRLVARIDDALEGCPARSLLHGDLWSGNTFSAADGRPALIDPAVYVGDGEVDLAMTELFGGFDPALYRAYEELRPITPEYRSHRRALYHLYYLLVHVNLFGDGYAAASRAAAIDVVTALG